MSLHSSAIISPQRRPTVHEIAPHSVNKEVGQRDRLTSHRPVPLIQVLPRSRSVSSRFRPTSSLTRTHLRVRHHTIESCFSRLYRAHRSCTFDAVIDVPPREN